MPANDSESGRNARLKWQPLIWVGAIFLLLLPLIAMQFTNEVAWGLLDFGVFGCMLLVACATYELAARSTFGRAYCAATAVALLAAFFLVWIILAVGVIGSEQNPANAMYGGVLAVGAITAFVRRFTAQGMVMAMIVTAMLQVAVAIIAIAFAFGGGAPAWPIDIVVLTGFFTVLWVGAALLFRSAARAQSLAESKE